MTTNNTLSASTKASHGFVLPSTTLLSAATLIKNGEVYVWGHRGNGLAGNGIERIQQDQPYNKASLPDTIVGISSAGYVMMALDSKDNLYGWGNSVGTGVYAKVGSPAVMPELIMGNVSQMAHCDSNGYAIDKNGGIWGWGTNNFKQLPGYNSGQFSPVPINIQGEHGRLIASGYQSTIVITKEGHVWGFGLNQRGKLGISDPSTDSNVPVATRGKNLEPYAKQIIQIALGSNYGIALLNDGRLIGWGSDAYLGINQSGAHFEPVVIMDNVAKFHALDWATAVLTKDGAIYTFGAGAFAHYRFLSVLPVQCMPDGSAIDIGGTMNTVFYQAPSGKIYGVGSDNCGVITQSIYNASIGWPGKEIAISAELNL